MNIQCVVQYLLSPSLPPSLSLSLPPSLSLLCSCIESLSICPVSELRPIRHWEVGKYFKSFTGDRYIPNNALQEKYPKTTVDQ